MKKSRPPRKKGLEADYRGATPEQVAKALLRSRPAPSVTPKKVSDDPTCVNPST